VSRSRRPEESKLPLWRQIAVLCATTTAHRHFPVKNLIPNNDYFRAMTGTSAVPLNLSSYLRGRDGEGAARSEDDDSADPDDASG